MGRKGWLVVAAAVAIVSGYVSWQAFLSPEAKVRRVIGAAAAAAESVDIPTFFACFSDDYTDFLHAGRQEFEERVQRGFEQVDRLNVTVKSLRADVSGDVATARFDLVVVALKGEQRYVAVGTPLQPEPVMAALRLTPAGWKLTRVDRDTTERSQ